jgi:uncharacterized repeat protein (TIGR01451 family)
LWEQTDGVLRVEVGNVGVGEGKEVGLVVRGATEGVWTNEFAARGLAADGDPENNGVIWVSEVRRETDLAVGLELGQELGLVGRELEYEVVVTNLGPHEARSVVVEVEWVGKVEVVRVEPSQGDWAQTASQLAWTVGDVPALAVVRLTVVVEPSRAGQVNCVATGTTLTADPVLENDTAAVGIEVLLPADLVLAQSANRSPVLVGDQLTYTITVQNRGDYAVGDIRLTDELPAGVELVSTVISQGVVTNEAGVIEWQLGPLDPGLTASVLAVVVPQETGLLTNRVTLESSYVDSENADLTSELVIESVAAPPLSITPDGSRVVLAWPAIAEDYVLEVTENLGEGSTWLVDGNPYVVVDNQVTVTVKVTNGRRFYRLVRP